MGFCVPGHVQGTWRLRGEKASFVHCSRSLASDFGGSTSWAYALVQCGHWVPKVGRKCFFPAEILQCFSILSRSQFIKHLPFTTQSGGFVWTKKWMRRSPCPQGACSLEDSSPVIFQVDEESQYPYCVYFYSVSEAFHIDAHTKGFSLGWLGDTAIVTEHAVLELKLSMETFN